MFRTYQCDCGTRYDVTSIEDGQKIQCSRCNRVAVLSRENIQIEPRQVTAQAVEAVPGKRSEEKVACGSLTFWSGAIGVILGALLIGAFLAPWAEALSTEPEAEPTAWVWDHMARLDVAGAFEVLWMLIAGMLALFLVLTVRPGMRGAVILLVAVAPLVLPVLRNPALQVYYNRNSDFTRAFWGLTIVSAAALYARCFVAQMNFFRVVLALLGAALIASFFISPGLIETGIRGGVSRWAQLGTKVSGCWDAGQWYLYGLYLPLFVAVLMILSAVLPVGGRIPAVIGALFMAAYLMGEAGKMIWEQGLLLDFCKEPLRWSVLQSFRVQALPRCCYLMLMAMGLGEMFAAVHLYGGRKKTASGA